jgi:threonine synthase
VSSAEASATFALRLACTSCGKALTLDERYKCPHCGGILDVVYDHAAQEKAGAVDVLARRSGESMWDFRQMLPLSLNTPAVSLGEGWTPLVAARRPGLFAGSEGAAVRGFRVPSAVAEKEARSGHDRDARLWLKLESANPTGSFKDRPVSVALSKAVELGVAGVITASSGNAGASVAAYAARAGLPAVVLVPDGLAASKLTQIGMYGATLVAVRGNFSRAFELAAGIARETDWYNVTTTFLSAFPTEGNKTVAYELLQQLGRVPEHIVVPVGSGPLLAGALKGFEELKRFGITDRLPAMTAVQAEGCAPIARSFTAGSAVVDAWDEPQTVASGINDPLQGYADDGTLTLARVRDTRGSVFAVADEAILAATRTLARDEGVLAEPTGAVAVAGLPSLLGTGVIAPGDDVVCLITGHGLKDTGAVKGLVAPPIVIDADMSQLRAIVAHTGG